MELYIKPDTRLQFTGYLSADKPNDFRKWFAPLAFQEDELEIGFSEILFSRNPETATVDWEGIQTVLEYVLPQLPQLCQQSLRVLISLNREIFGDEYEQHGGYFTPVHINISKLQLNRSMAQPLYFEVEWSFYLDSKSGFLLDPYFTYYTTFVSFMPNLLTLQSARRE